MLTSLDTETTGVDLYHGAKPFFVTLCRADGTQKWWEWLVNPETREPLVPESDLDEIAEAMSPNECGNLVLQNPKFDVKALATLRREFGDYWRWADTIDTLMASHLLSSNTPHDLTSLAALYLGLNIQPLEDRLEAAVKECRRIVQQAQLRFRRGTAADEADATFAAWRIASDAAEDMPSAREKTWKFDTWLPRAMVEHLWGTSEAFRAFALEVPAEKCRRMAGWEYRPPDVEGGEHPYWTVLSEYANVDSAVTLALWPVMKAEIDRRGLGKVYAHRLKLLPVAWKMEDRGVTVSKDRLDRLRDEYRCESEAAGRVCVNVAASMGHELTLPKSGNNGSLLDFAESPTGLDAPAILDPDFAMTYGKGGSKEVNRRGGTWGKNGRICLDKAAVGSMMEVLEAVEPRGKRLAFLKALTGKRKRDTAVNYMDGYERFWLPWVPVGPTDPSTGAGWYVLHPSLNPTGTDTLRWSSSNPNEQNISKQEGFNLRYCFGPAPGREWWSLDAKNIELRIPAYVSGEAELIALFERPKEPPYYGSTHLLNFHTVYPDVWEGELGKPCGNEKCCGEHTIVDLTRIGPHCKKKFGASFYQWCKNGGFAVQYGAVDKPDADPRNMTSWGTADRAFHRFGSHGRLKARFSRLEALNQECIRFAEKHGYVETVYNALVDSEKGYPVVCSRTEYGRIKPTVPLNYKIQSSAMLWTAVAMVLVDQFFEALNDGGRFAGRKWPGGYHLAMQVHDELVPDMPGGRGKGANPWDYNLPIVNECRRLMESIGEAFSPRVPTPVGAEYHEHNWSEGVTL